MSPSSLSLPVSDEEPGRRLSRASGPLAGPLWASQLGALACFLPAQLLRFFSHINVRSSLHPWEVSPCL